MYTVKTRRCSSSGSAVAVDFNSLRIFEEPDVARKYECCVCYEVKEKPKQCENGHITCRNCVDGMKKAKGQIVCPTCKSDAPLFSCRITATVIESLVTYCPTTDALEVHENCCLWVGPYIDRNRHEKGCDFAVVQCKAGKCYMKFTRRELVVHQQNTCNYRKVPCEICLEEFQFARLAKHQVACEEAHRIMDCEHGCGAQFAVKDEDEHNEHCPARGMSPQIALLTTKLNKTEETLHNMSGKLNQLSEENASLREQLHNLKTVVGTSTSNSNGQRVVFDLTRDEENARIDTQRQAQAERAAAEEKAQRDRLVAEEAVREESVRQAEIETERQKQAERAAAEEKAQHVRLNKIYARVKERIRLAEEAAREKERIRLAEKSRSVDAPVPVSAASRKRERSEECQTVTERHYGKNNCSFTSQCAPKECYEKRRRENDFTSREEGRSAPLLWVEHCVLVGTDGYNAREPVGHRISCVNEFEHKIVWHNTYFVDAVTRGLLVAWVNETDHIENNVSRIETLLQANKLFHIAEQFDSAAINSMREGDVIRGSDHFFGLCSSVVAVYLEARRVMGSLTFIVKRGGLYCPYEIIPSRVVIFSKPMERSLSRGMSGKRCFRSIALHNKFADNTVRVLFTFDLKEWSMLL